MRSEAKAGKVHSRWTWVLGCFLGMVCLPTVQAAPFVQVAGGYYHTCAVESDGAVFCWGDNDSGQLGDGHTEPASSLPVEVYSLGTGSGVVAVTAGSEHSCALKGDGSVLCWGDNDNGQLGDNGSESISGVPVEVSTLGTGSEVIAVSAGNQHTCALKSDGAVLCWGDNHAGQIGVGDTWVRLAPTAVSGLDAGSGVVAITAGDLHTCALKGDGSVLCWGANWYGQLGDGDTAGRLVPTAVSGFGTGSEVVAFVAGSEHTCALKSDGAVLCWGYNKYGQIGDGSTTNGLAPAEVSGLGTGAGVTAIAAGGFHSCAIKSDGTMACWGYNYDGELGTGGIPQGLTPTMVNGLDANSGTMTVSAGSYHTCALKSDGGALCWGHNGPGALGDGSTTDHSVPTAVSGLGAGSGTTAVSAGSDQTCALEIDGTVLCWGDNSIGQLGDGSMTHHSVPTVVSSLGAGSQVTAINVGDYHSCALKSDGTVLCWGGNQYGQIGDGTTTNQLVPIAVSGFGPDSGVIAVSAGTDHTCALKSNGAVLCWGDNRYGQIGDGSTSSRLVPTAVSGLGTGSDVIAVSAGGDHTCALKLDGALLCWGRNRDGQIGDGSTTDRSIPTAVSGFAAGSGVAALTTGYQHTCALKSDGAMLCWGDNRLAQVGDSSTTNRLIPTAVSGLGAGSEVTAVSAGRDHTCALKNDGTLLCWGDNSYRQLGTGEPYFTTPQPVRDDIVFGDGFDGQSN